MKKMVTGVLALVMVLVMVGCGQKDNGVVNGVAKDGATIGEGAKSFTTEVVDKDGGKVTFTVKTDADTVGKALLDQGVIAGEDSSYGLYSFCYIAQICALTTLFLLTFWLFAYRIVGIER